MRIKAIRLRDVGVFRDPVAIEGFSGELDVLAGPNELGKSTIFRALEAAFLRPHRATGKSIDALRARGGGDARIEADFEAEGGRWRISKRFGRSKRAELLDLHSGRVAASGLEAEERLASLIGLSSGSGGRFGLLWVGQRSLLTSVAPDFDADGKHKDRGERALLMSAVEREVEAVAGGGEAEQIRRKVAAALAEFRGGRAGAAKANSELDRALKEEARLSAELRTLRERHSQLVARLDELDALTRRRRELARPDRQAALLTARDRANGALATAEKAHAELRLAQAQQSRCEVERDAARLALEQHDALRAELAALEDGLAGSQSSEADMATRSAAAEQAAADARSVLARHEQEERELLELGTLRARLDAREAALAAFAEIEGRCAEAARIEAEIAGLAGRVRDNPVTPELMARLRAEQGSVDVIAARLLSGSPALRFELEAKPVARVRLDGAAPPAGEVRLLRPAVIEIDGVGRILVSPGQGEGIDEDQRDLEAHRATLARLMSLAGVDDLGAAEARAITREQDRTEGARLKARLGALAPKGVAALLEERGAIERRIGAAIEGERPPLAAEIHTRLEAARRSASEARKRVEATRKAAERLAAERAAVSLELARKISRRDAIAERLPQPSERPSEHARLEGLAEAATQALAAATTHVRSLVESAPDAPALAGLRQAAALAARALEDHTIELHDIEKRIERIAGELSRAEEDGLEAQIGRLEGLLERADAEVRRLQGEADALALLSEALDAAETETRERFLQPVLARLEPYLGKVLPEARLVFGEGFALEQVARAGVVEDVGVLSGGTQEQLAVLVRLGFGRLIADAGHPAPLILDDALVYSDDDRIARMFEALQLAATSHQVIVLTCRERSFRGLGGNRLALTPWVPAPGSLAAEG